MPIAGQPRVSGYDDMWAPAESSALTSLSMLFASSGAETTPALPVPCDMIRLESGGCAGLLRSLETMLLGGRIAAPCAVWNRSEQVSSAA